tara:strand:- start:443 stop:634 length:192 start_codon:yes stop_codon:yes gene_type:complete
MKKIELICGGLAIISVVGGLFLIPGSSALLFIAMIILSCFYFFFSFALFNEIAIVKILSKGSY